MAGYEQITYEVKDHVATITLNRPERRNGYTTHMADELRDAFDAADRDDDVRVVVLAGAGDHFCVGADLSEGGFDFSPDMEDPDSWAEPAGRVTTRMLTLNKPVIAALHGSAVGVGITLPLAADFRLAATGTKFGFPFVRRGIAPEGGSHWLLPRLVGLGKALDWLLTGRIFGEQEALASGLVRSVHAPEDLLPETYRVAAEIAANAAPVSVAITRQMLYRVGLSGSLEEVHRLESRLIREMLVRPDALEGVVSFFQKRPPRFPTTVSEGLFDFLPWVDEARSRP